MENDVRERLEVKYKRFQSGQWYPPCQVASARDSSVLGNLCLWSAELPGVHASHAPNCLMTVHNRSIKTQHSENKNCGVSLKSSCVSSGNFKKFLELQDAPKYRTDSYEGWLISLCKPGEWTKRFGTIWHYLVNPWQVITFY